MNCRGKLFVLSVTTLMLTEIAAIETSSVKADSLEYSNNTNRELCASYTNFAAANNDPWNAWPYYSSQHDQSENALGNASWMILREGVWSKRINTSGTCNNYWSHDWFDGSEEDFNSWYEPQSRVASWCGAGSVGCTGTDWAFPGWSSILAADTVVARDFNWGVINQDTINDYLETSQNCASSENVWLHELGHAYGMDHVSSQPATMGNGSFCVKNINITQANSDQMWPLDYALMRPMYEVSGTRRNFSASVFRRVGGVDNRDASSVQFATSSANAFFSIRYSALRYFGSSTGTVQMQLRFVRDGLQPSFNWSTKTWTWPSDSSSYLYEIHTFPSAGVDTATLGNTGSFYIMRSELPGPTGSWYRLWMFVDYNYSHEETDEGDNMIPTQMFVVKQ